MTAPRETRTATTPAPAPLDDSHSFPACMVCGAYLSDPEASEPCVPVTARAAAAEDTPMPADQLNVCGAPLTDFVIDAGTCQRTLGHQGIHWFLPDAEPPLDVGLRPLTEEQKAEGERLLHEAGPFADLGRAAAVEDRP